MLEPKFELGQKVYGISDRKNTKRVHKKCKVCKSTGMVELNEEFYECPACHGYMETIDYGYEYYIAYSNAEIGRIQVTEYLPKYKQYHKSEITYMLKPTGVGSGALWQENMLFATKEEAQEFCKNYIPKNGDWREPVLKPQEEDNYL